MENLHRLTEKQVTGKLPVKKMLPMFLAFVLAFSLTACGQSGGAESTAETELSISSDSTEAAGETAAPEGTEAASEAAAPESTGAAGEAGGKTLVAYFSWSGNTAQMASYIAEQTGGDLLEILPETPYPEDYNECGDVALAERDSNARPAIANLPASIGEYDTILIGYPIWWHTAPMIIGTFLESFDLTGVQVYPFTQSASMDTEQFDNSMEFVRQSAAGAQVHDGLFADPADTESIDAYLTENGLLGSQGQ